MIFWDNDYTVKRKATGTISATTGKFTDGAETSIIIQMNVQPITGKFLDSLPEGRRNKKNIHGFSDDILHTSRGPGAVGLNPDLIVYEGEDYEIYEVTLFDNILGTHYEFKASKL